MNVKAAGSASKIEEGEEGFKRQGSFRKILPGTSSGDSQLNTSIKMIDRPNVTGSNAEYIVYLQEYSILSEYNLLQRQDLKGIYVIPSAQSSFLWYGVLFVRQGFYQGGVFRFTVSLPENFPDGGCPKVAFQTNVFHPQIHPETNELNTTVGFPEWKKSNRIYQLVQFIVKIFNKLDAKMPAINTEASTLLDTNLEEFRTRTKQCVRNSLDHIYDQPDTEDSHYIKFSPWDPEVHEPIRQRIYEPKQQEPERQPTGFSWVQPGSLQPLSKLQEPR